MGKQQGWGGGWLTKKDVVVEATIERPQVTASASGGLRATKPLACSLGSEPPLFLWVHWLSSSGGGTRPKGLRGSGLLPRL